VGHCRDFIGHLQGTVQGGKTLQSGKKEKFPQRQPRVWNPLSPRNERGFNRDRESAPNSFRKKGFPEKHLTKKEEPRPAKRPKREGSVGAVDWAVKNKRIGLTFREGVPYTV